MTILFALIIILFILLIFWIMKLNKLYWVYLTLISFISILAVAITLWIVITTVGKYFIISDEEYLQYEQSWKLDNCKYNNYSMPEKVDNEDSQITTPSKEEIAECEAKVRSEITLSRAYDLKETLLSSSAWFVIFLILFIFHYPKFRHLKEEK